MLGMIGFITSVSADYSMGSWNGSSGGASAPAGACSGMTATKYCNFNNMNHFTIRATLYYFDGNGGSEIWGSVVTSTNQGYVNDIKGDGDNAALDPYLPFKSLASPINTSAMANYFLANDGAQFWRYVELMGIPVNNVNSSGKPSDLASPTTPATKGFRMIIEPVFSFLNGAGKVVHKTPKTMAKEGITTTNSVRVKENSWRLHTDFTDVGIVAPSGQTDNLALIANDKIGYGMAIIDITPILHPEQTSGDPNRRGSCLCPDGTDHAGEDLYCTVQNEKNNGYTYTCADAQKKWCNDKTIENLPDNCDGNCTEREVYEIKTKSIPAVCTATNDNNLGTYWEYTVKKKVCDNKTNDVTNSSSKGRYIRRISNYCHLYCLETAQTSFPGNIADSLQLGTKLVWPTSSSNYGTWKTDLYPLILSGTMSCQFDFEGEPEKDYNELKVKRDQLIAEAESLERKAEGCHYEEHSYESCSTDSKGVEHCSTEHETVEEPYDGCHDDLDTAREKRAEAARLWTQMEAIRNDMWTCLSSSYDSDDKDIYNFQAGVSVYYDDDEYGQSVSLEEESTDSDCDGCDYEGNLKSTSSFNSLVSGINNRTIKIKKAVTFKLPDNLYQYVNKKDLSSASSVAASELANYYKINYSNLPISWSATLKKNNYHVGIQSITLGHNGRFSAEANKKDYTCKYNVTNTITGCQCPDGTTNAGKDLYCKIKSENDKGHNYTCADGQVLWCNSNDFKDSDQYCGGTYCPNDPTMNISSCILGGQSYSWCVSNLCNKKKYECPSNTPNAYMDITPCVQTKMAQGYTLTGAIQVCESVVCPAGLKIIYRTIDLANPFPAKDKEHEFSALSTGMFNYNVKGRYPGTNWNSKLLVSKEILNNRGVKANDLYAKNVTPLYTITLDPKAIGKIRQYNKQQKQNDNGYGDFTLDCTNGSKCISNKFLRQTLGNYFTGGTCKSINKYNFYECSEVKS